MIAILKRVEPNELTEYRQQPDAVYDGPNFTAVKNAIRKSLVKKQGYLCAYCMRRIEPTQKKMKIEHWHCQDTYPNEGLNYTNMLGCCYGNEGNAFKDQHCDTHKGNMDILFNPGDETHHSKLRIHFKGNGTISSSDEKFDKQINNVLNLNYNRLKSNRQAVWQSVTKMLTKIQGSATFQQIKNLIRQWDTKNSQGKFKEYKGVAIYYLEKKLKRMS